MKKIPPKKKRPADINRLAYSIVRDSVADEPAGDALGHVGPDAANEPPSEALRQAAAALGRRGGLKGGKARAAKLTPKRRAEIAKKAAAARWGKTTE